MTKTYYKFRQMPGCGVFYYPAEVLFVSAQSASEANLKADKAGVDFEDWSCPYECCGRRWGRAQEGERTFTEDEMKEWSAYYEPFSDDVDSILVIE